MAGITCPRVRQFFTHPKFPERLSAAHGRTVTAGDYPWTGEGTLARMERNARTPDNAEYAKKNTAFQQCCERAGVEPTARQASKFRNGKGAAYAALKKG